MLRGPTNDGLGEYYRQMIEESGAEPVDVAQVLRDKKVDVLVSYLPVGSEQADKAYAQAAMDAGCAFVNCLPVFIASDPEWAQKFRDAGVPIVGDDIKSQVGATITHRVLARLFEDRGVRLDRTYQLNVGGNMDFMNMLQRSRLESKKISRPAPSPPWCRTIWTRTMCISARPITWHGLTTASSRSCVLKAPRSAMCH